jgi:serine/threonine-protein kinase
MIGSRLGPWVIDKEIGRGGMGCVYLAHADPTPADGPQRAAVKVLAAELSVDPGFLQRFQREIEILRQLDHPHIVRFHGSGVEGGRYFFAMEYVAGPSFETIRDERGRLPWAEVLDLALQIAPALKHAHDRGVIHRDIKPSNLVRTEESTNGSTVVKLTDFGIASLFASPHLTATGGVVGTAEYLSPEQAAGKTVTRRSDLYSLGVVLYTLVTGRTPFQGEVVDLLHKHCFAQYELPSRLVPEIPPDFEAIICQLLEKDPARRPADGAVLHRRLDSLRRKIERKEAHTEVDKPDAVSAPSTRSGPATLMSQLVRQELEQQNRGGPVQQFFNRPLVLIVLFVLTVGILVWTFWPTGPETLFRRGAELMAKEDPDEWQRGWDEFLEPLKRKYPDSHREEVAEFEQRIDGLRQAKQATIAARRAGPMSEAQWFYQQGLRFRQQGNEKKAREVWQALVKAFGEVPSEAPWVRLAKRELDKEDPEQARKLEPVRAAVERVRQLRKEGKDEKAQAILAGLEELYRDDPEAQAALKGANAAAP